MLILCSTMLPVGAQQNSIRLVVPFQVGGPSDLIARTLQITLSEELKMPVLLEHRLGGNGQLATEIVAGNRSRELVLMIGGFGTVTNHVTKKHKNIDMAKDLRPMSYLGQVPLILVARKNFPYTTMESFAQRPREQDFFYGSAGIGSAPHLAVEQLNQFINRPLTHVPFKGSGDALPALMAGTIDLMFAYLNQINQQIDNRLLIPLAIASANRHPDLKTVPTFRELGYTNFHPFSWFILYANSTADPVLYDKAKRAVRKVMTDPVTGPQFKRQSLEYQPNEIDQAQQYFDRAVVDIAKILQKVNIDN